jgi:hypothetical protein
MPTHPMHHKVCQTIIGRSYPLVDKVIDWPVRVLGPAHRKHFHSFGASFLIGTIITGSIIGGLAGILHVIVDLASDIWKAILRMLR